MAGERVMKTSDSITTKAARFVVRDVLFDVARFPRWWYTTGAVSAARFVWQEFQSFADRLSIRILFRNLLKPMYGDYSRSGRVISLFMRLVVFAFHALGFVVWSAFLLAAFLLWLLAIPLVIYQIILQVSG